MLVEYDTQGDTLIVSFEFRERLGKARQLDIQRLLLHDQQGELVGVEFLAASKGVDLTDVPRSDEIIDAVQAFRGATATFATAPVGQSRAG
jgi:uncharacterized protein YuzE